MMEAANGVAGEASGTVEDRLDTALAEYLQGGARPGLTSRRTVLERYPQFAAEIEEFFAGEDALHQAGCPTLPQGAPAGAGHEGDDMTGRTFGDYELLQEIARGGMGVVYQARQLSAGRVVAIKMILAGQFAGGAEIKRFVAEAESVAALDHPNIVPVYEIGEHDGQHYFTMRFVEGGSLADHAGRYRHDPGAAATLLATVARAIHYAHQRGVLHRDLKPANVLIDAAGTPLVSDFGLARRLSPGDQAGLTLSGVVVGSPRYMAPEQARSEKVLTVAADVYGLGAVLYEVVTGQPPFAGADASEVLRQVREREPRRPSELNPRVDAGLEAICLRCLEKDPERRYASASALADDLEHWLRGEPTEARSPDVIDTEELFLMVQALRAGDFTRRMPQSYAGRAAEVALHLNRLGQQLDSLLSEVTRIADEVGVQGKLGGTADVIYAPAGPWKRAVDAVNALSYNLTAQLRDVNKSLKQVARGVYSRPVTAPHCGGEILELKDAVNAILDAGPRAPSPQ